MAIKEFATKRWKNKTFNDFSSSWKTQVLLSVRPVVHDRPRTLLTDDYIITAICHRAFTSKKMTHSLVTPLDSLPEKLEFIIQQFIIQQLTVLRSAGT